MRGYEDIEELGGNVGDTVAEINENLKKTKRVLLTILVKRSKSSDDTFYDRAVYIVGRPIPPRKEDEHSV